MDRARDDGELNSDSTQSDGESASQASHTDSSDSRAGYRRELDINASTDSSGSAHNERAGRMGCAGSRDGVARSPDGSVSYGRRHESGAGGGGRVKVAFDRTVPAEHKYLGGDLEEVRGERTLYDAGEVLDRVPLFPVPHVVLMPGRTLPLSSLHPRAVAMFRRIIDDKAMFAVVSIRYDSSAAGAHALGSTAMSPVGTLAQILAYKEHTEHELTTLKLRAIGRQRFTLLDTSRMLDGTLMARVKIRPDVGLPFPLVGGETAAFRRLRAGAKSPDDRARYAGSVVTPWPPMVYRANDVEYIVGRIVLALRDWYEAEQLRLMAHDPDDFSFWVASCMPIEDGAKLGLLSLDCTLRRLTTELHLLHESSSYVCGQCACRVTMRSEIFSMSVDGPMAAYVNPAGHVHEMLTVLHATNYRRQGAASRQNSWFPGYAWTILSCAGCDSHLGWLFTAAVRRSSLRPRRFYGLTRAALRPAMDEGNVEKIVTRAAAVGGGAGADRPHNVAEVDERSEDAADDDDEMEEFEQDE